MKYEIHITRTAENDLNETADYIEYILYNPTAADDMIKTAGTRISELEFMPDKHPLVDDPILREWGIRFITVKNYLVFYIVRETERRVYIVRFLYARRDWKSILRKGFEFE